MTKFQDVEAPYTTYSEEAAPITPAAGRGKTYYGTDKALHVVDDTGADTALGAGGGGAVATDAIWDAKGDLAGGTGANTAARLAVGTNGKVLTADSTQATGLNWTTPAIGDAKVADTLDQFADVTQAAGMTLAISDNTTLAGGTHSGSNTGDQTLGGLGGQPLDTDLTAIAALTSAANKAPYATGAGTWALADFDAVGRAIVAPSDALGAVDKLVYVIAAGTGATAALTAAGRALLDDAAASDQRTTLGLGTLATQSGTFSGTSSGTNTGDQATFAAAGITGQVAIANGGTGAATAAAAVDALGGAASVGTGGLVRASAAGSTVALLGSDVANADVTPNTIADVTGLSFAVTSGVKYWFKFTIPYTAAATTTGSRWSINGPTTTFLFYHSQYDINASSWTVNNLNGYDLPAACNASTPTAGLGGLAFIEGFITPSANGTLIARFASEISASAITAKAGAFVEYRVVG